MVVQPDPLINTGKCRLRVGSEINSHSVFKMSSAFRTFENRLCEVIFERSLREKSFKHWQCNPLRVHFFLK